ncbi:quinone oxidoreductase family protein [Paenibacillus pinistramenti]|uniref:quinone oxidoreductase family protein n=1 Tax=Paenibacillus pinistramenti TaxID=1768003 RepID=UPI00110932C7|nr:quinone oxidoreductase [Paenibacillus pinistramenti]
MKALVFEAFGGPEVLQFREVEDPVIGPNEILVRMQAIGLNFADVYRRRGNYHLAGNPPYILGYEGAGIVEKVGSSVTGVKAGDTVGFADVPFANAELVAVPFEKAIPLPAGISCETAASVLLQGLTAHYLTRDSYIVKQGDTVLVHAAAGGVGQLLIQIVKMLGAAAIGLVSTDSKRQAAAQAGASSVLLYSDNWVERIKELTEGIGVDAVYESVGATLSESFEAVRTGGTVVFYGMAGGDPAYIDPRMLMDTSKTLTGGDLWNVLTSRKERLKRAHELFEWITSGQLCVPPVTTFPLAEGVSAHQLLESRKSVGKILLIP